MIILHTGWDGAALFIWGESGNAGAGPERADGLSPYDPGAAGLFAAVRAALRDVELPPGPAEERPLELPSSQGARAWRPVPSHAFLEGDAGAADGAPLPLRPWRVHALALPWRSAFTLLGLCGERRLCEGVFAGESLLAFAALFRYAGALAARGRFLPDLRPGAGGGFEARWRPSLDREELRRLEQLAASLPLCACGSQPARPVAEAFLDDALDRLVRVSVVTTLSRAQAERGKHYSAHDAWFSALRGESRRVRWEFEGDLEQLARQLEDWRRPVEGGRSRREQVSLALREPRDPAEPWPLQIELRAPAGGPPTESLLIALGQAAALFPPLGAAERRGDALLACALTAVEAHAFLTLASPLLLAAGYEVQLPAWWRAGEVQALALEAEAAPHSGRAEAPERPLDERVDLRWAVTLDGQPVSAEELSSLLLAQSPLVFFRGRWIQVDLRQIQSALRIGRSHATETRSALEVVRLALGTGGRHGGLEVAAVRASGWLDPFLKRLSGEQAFETLPAPGGFCGELRPYQQRGYSWLACLRGWGFGACLADDMGLGKTVQALAFLLHQREAGERRPVLLVGPMSVLGNWVKEARRFAPELRCHLHHGAARAHGASFAREAAGAAVVITSYNLLYRDYADLRKVAWAGVLLDEAQNIKNPDTQQAQAARALQADYRLALTGTPMENNVGDLWSLMDFLNPGLLGRRTAFRESYFRPIQSGTDPGARVRLRRVTAPFILRRLKTDRQVIADLPDKVEGKVYCTLTLEQARLYEEVLEAFQREVRELEGVARRGRILAVLTRLKQVCNHPAHYLGQVHAAPRRSGKLARLEEMLEEVFARGESALVFTQYAEMGALLKRRLCHAFARDMPFLHGGVARGERDRLVQGFQESAEPLAFVLSLKAGGTGLNLTRATHVFHFDRWWNPAVENQATDRAFRIGQTRNVMVHKFLCGGTLEERIDAMIASKTALAEEIVSSGESFLTELSNEALREVLSLSEAAVADE